MSKRKLWLGIISLSMVAFLTAGCDGGEDVGFGIFLVDSGELVLSEQHIKVYHKDTHVIELNEEGIEKWNSYMTYVALPMLADGLFEEDFKIMVEGTEAYRGQFFSVVASTIPSGVLILDTLFKLDSENNSIWIVVGFPPLRTEEDPRNNTTRIVVDFQPLRPEGDLRNNPDIFRFLEERGLLE